MATVHAEIEYTNKDGQDVHSDICPPECDIKYAGDEYRIFLHTCLDEWLNNSNGTGGFYVKDEGHKFNFQEPKE